MKHIYAVTTKEELEQYRNFTEKIQPRLSNYIEFLKQEYAVCDLPRSIVWTSTDIATSLISNIPIPAYTNDFRIIMTPDVDSWRCIYLRQLDSLEQNEQYLQLHDYYSNKLSENHTLQILGHELAHHSALFLEDFDSAVSDGIWFEEGMAEYISRRYFLTDEEYETEYQNNLTLVNLLGDKYGDHSLEEFGASTYDGDYASIFFEYWRSFLAIHQIVQNHNGDVKAVFKSYHRWAETMEQVSLMEWFGVES